MVLTCDMSMCWWHWSKKWWTIQDCRMRPNDVCSASWAVNACDRVRQKDCENIQRKTIALTCATPRRFEDVLGVMMKDTDVDPMLIANGVVQFSRMKCQCHWFHAKELLFRVLRICLSSPWHTVTTFSTVTHGNGIYLENPPMLVHCAVFQVCKRLSVPCVWLSRFLWDCLEPVASLCPMWHIPHRDARLQVEDRWEQQGYRTAIDSHLRYCRALDLLSHAKSMLFIFLWVYRMVPPSYKLVYKGGYIFLGFFLFF